MSLLTSWRSFYVIVGSSAGALTGLTFVVISLITGRQLEDARRGVNAFTTPIIVHFSVVLLVAALLSAPWTAVAPVAILLGLGGLGGLVYACLVVSRLGQVSNYDPEWDDWLWYGVLPLLAYSALLISAILLPSHGTSALFAIAAALVLLLAVGIRDAWDVVTWMALERLARADIESDRQTTGTEGV